MGDVEREDPLEIHEDAEVAPGAEVPDEVEERLERDDEKVGDEVGG